MLEDDLLAVMALEQQGELVEGLDAPDQLLAVAQEHGDVGLFLADRIEEVPPTLYI